MNCMNKYLNQTCTIQRVLRDDSGKAVLDIYGSPSYGNIKSTLCRREESTVDVITQGGSLLRSENRFFLAADESVGLEDLLDGKPVLNISKFTDRMGNTVGYECRV